METIRAIVKSVLIIIMTTAFLEIVLPRSDIKRYINLIIGLFIVIAVLNPFLKAVHREFSFDVFDQAAVQDSETQAIISKGKEMAASQKSQATRQYREKLSKQISALAELYPNTVVKGVQIDMVENTTDPNFGQVKRITLFLTGSGGQKDSRNAAGPSVVEEIQIEGEPAAGTGKESSSGAANKGGGQRGLQEMIANFYGLTPEQVAIQN